MASMDEYHDILDYLGIVNVTHNDKVLRRSVGLYLNRTRSGYIYFTFSNPRLKPDLDLWDLVPDDKVKKTNPSYRNYSPKPGMEREALIQLLGDNSMCP